MDECNLEIYEDFIDVRDFDKDVFDFNAPTQVMLDDLEVGDCVEVNHNGERFWNEIEKFCGSCDLVAKVYQDLVFDHPFAKGSLIKFSRWNIYTIKKGGC